jgi:DNA mismatch endonuclease (patch repair protein)
LVVNRTLRRIGWRVLRVWQHELTRKNEIRLIRRIQRALS